MVLLPTSFIRASGFLFPLLELQDVKNLQDLQEVKEYEKPQTKAHETETYEIDVPLPFSKTILLHLVELFEGLKCASPGLKCASPGLKCASPDNFHVLHVVVKDFPDLVSAASFLQIEELTSYFVKILNKWCQYDNPDLVCIEGLINPFWLGQLSDLKSATKVWLGLIKLPLSEEQKDDSCFSSDKMLSPFFQKVYMSENVLEACLKNNDSSRCKEIFIKFNIDVSVLNVKLLAAYGSLELLKFAYDNGCKRKMRNCVLFQAAVRGEVDILKWGYDLPETDIACCNYLSPKLLCEQAARHAHVSILDWFFKRDGKYTDYNHAIELAAYSGHMNVIKWASENQIGLDNAGVCDNAVESGKLENLQFVRECGFTWHETTCTQAAKYGYLNILQWAIRMGCPINVPLCITYARLLSSKTETLNWLRENFLL